jgi:hypothetical protein
MRLTDERHLTARTAARRLSRSVRCGESCSWRTGSGSPPWGRFDKELRALLHSGTVVRSDHPDPSLWVHRQPPTPVAGLRTGRSWAMSRGNAPGDTDA